MPDAMSSARGATPNKGNEQIRWSVQDHGFDFQDPRICAAMKVTGIQPADLEVEAAPPDGVSEMELRRYEVKERKRHKLLSDLQDTANGLDARDIDALITGPGPVDERGVFLEEKAKIDLQRKRAKAELTRKATFKVENQQATILYKKDYDAMTRRLMDQREEKRQMREARACEKQLKVETNIQAARARQREDRKRIVQKLQETEDRVGKNLEAILQQRGAKTGAVQEKAEENARRLDEHLETQMELTMRKDMFNRTRIQQLEGWIDRRDREQMHKQMDNKAQFSDRRMIVEEKQAVLIQERAQSAVDNRKKIATAREHASDFHTSLAESVKEKRTVRHEKWLVNHQAIKAERRKKTRELEATFNSAQERSNKLVQEYQEATIGRYTGVREIFNELVADNKERLGRADDATRDYRLGKITHHQARSQSRQDQMQQADSYRVEGFRERVAGQTQVEELQELLNISMQRAVSPTRSGARSANSNVGIRMHAILADLGVPIPPSPTAADGEDGAANAGGEQGK